MEHSAGSLEEKQQEWEAQGKLLTRFYEAKQAVEPPENFADAFKPQDKILRCIDERTKGGLPLAGSGMLLKRDEALQIAREMRIEAVTSHEGCGAAKIAVERLNGPTPDDVVERYAREWSIALAEDLGVPYAGHLTVSPYFHNARIAYYDGTGLFDWSRVNDLPAGFRISRKYLSPDYAKTEIGIAVSIAMGFHGYGSLFVADKIGAQKNSEFILAAIGNSKTLPNLMEELETVAKKYYGRVTIKTLQTPS